MIWINVATLITCVAILVGGAFLPIKEKENKTMSNDGLVKRMLDVLHNTDSRLIGPMLVSVLSEFPQFQIAYRWNVELERLDMIITEIRPDDEGSQIMARAREGQNHG